MPSATSLGRGNRIARRYGKPTPPRPAEAGCGSRPERAAAYPPNSFRAGRVPAMVLWAAADAQVFGCDHPNIATKKHATKQIIWRPICIQ
jgi:hypothetical protein